MFGNYTVTTCNFFFVIMIHYIHIVLTPTVMQLCQEELRIEFPLEYLEVHVLMATLVSLLFRTMILINCKIINFSLKSNKAQTH